jgi:hypothetical protein
MSKTRVWTRVEAMGRARAYPARVDRKRQPSTRNTMPLAATPLSRNSIGTCVCSAM